MPFVKREQWLCQVCSMYVSIVSRLCYNSECNVEWLYGIVYAQYLEFVADPELVNPGGLDN